LNVAERSSTQKAPDPDPSNCRAMPQSTRSGQRS